MNEWHIREPLGKIDNNYPFDDSYKDLLSAQQASVIALTHDDGMKPEAISHMLENVLGQIHKSLASDEDYSYLIINDKQNITPKTFDEFSAFLKYQAKNIQTPWYWDGIKGVVKSSEASILVQPESDGIDIAIYIAGSESTFSSLISWAKEITTDERH